MWKSLLTVAVVLVAAAHGRDVVLPNNGLPNVIAHNGPVGDIPEPPHAALARDAEAGRPLRDGSEPGEAPKPLQAAGPNDLARDGAAGGPVAPVADKPGLGPNPRGPDVQSQNGEAPAEAQDNPKRAIPAQPPAQKAPEVGEDDNDESDDDFPRRDQAIDGKAVDPDDDEEGNDQAARAADAQKEAAYVRVEKNTGDSHLEPILLRSNLKTMLTGLRVVASDKLMHVSDKDGAVKVLGEHVDALERLVVALDPHEVKQALEEQERKAIQDSCKKTEQELEDQKFAFRELLDEKRYLLDVMEEEERTLEVLQERVQNPELGTWMRKRSERLEQLLSNAETEAVAQYAKDYVGPSVYRARDRIVGFEKQVEETIDYVLPARYGVFVAVLITTFIIGFPAVLIFRISLLISSTISWRQYVFLGNLFLTAFFSAVGMAGLVLRQDPFRTLHDASDHTFALLQISLAAVYIAAVWATARALMSAVSLRHAFVFGCELVFYAVVGANYHARVWRPALLGQPLDTSPLLYVVYIADFCSLTALTVSMADSTGQQANPMELPHLHGESTGSKASDGVRAGSSSKGLTESENQGLLARASEFLASDAAGKDE